MKKISIGILILALFIPLLIGGASAALSAKGMAMYAGMTKPPLSPPPWVFSVAWTILYLMMGLASYFILMSEVEGRSRVIALRLYMIQLVMNFVWSIIFFNVGQHLLAFIWLMIMWVIVIVCMVKFFRINTTASFLMLPYVLWLTFAAYLNFGVYILNR